VSDGCEADAVAEVGWGQAGTAAGCCQLAAGAGTGHPAGIEGICGKPGIAGTPGNWPLTAALMKAARAA